LTSLASTGGTAIFCWAIFLQNLRGYFLRKEGARFASKPTSHELDTSYFVSDTAAREPMITVTDIPAAELEFNAVRAAGPGGQHVNKVSSAIHLRYDVENSSLPPVVKERLLRLRDARVNRHGVIVIKAQNHRSQDQNKREALARLAEILARAQKPTMRRVKTRPTRASVKRRLNIKSRRSSLKRLRDKPLTD